MSMKLEESEAKINEVVKQRMKDLHQKGEYDLSQAPEEYEKIIQKLEAEVRNHISVQQQMKLYIESYQSKVEELEPIEVKAKKLENELSSLKRLNQEYSDKIDNVKKELDEKQSLFRKKLMEQEKQYSVQIEDLQSKIKSHRNSSHHHSTSLSRHESKSKYFHKKSEMSVDMPESQK